MNSGGADARAERLAMVEVLRSIVDAPADHLQANLQAIIDNVSDHLDVEEFSPTRWSFCPVRRLVSDLRL